MRSALAGSLSQEECDSASPGAGAAFQFEASDLVESSKTGRDGKLFAVLSNGQTVLLSNLGIPKVDSTAPAPPTDVAANGVPAEGEEASGIDVDWSGDGDPYPDNQNADASGIDEFAIKYRINGGAWSDEVLQSATDPMTYSTDASVTADDTVEFSIASIDAIGNRSAVATGSSTVAGTPAPPNSGPEPSLASGVYSDIDSERNPQMGIWSTWKSPSGRRYDSAELTVEVFDADVDQSSPGSPVVDPVTRTCKHAKSCSIDSVDEYAVGTYITRASIVLSDGVSTVHSSASWGEHVQLDEPDENYGSLNDASDEEPDDDASPTLMTSKNWKERCWVHRVDQPIVRVIKHRVKQRSCRLAFKIDGSSKVAEPPRKKKQSLSDYRKELAAWPSIVDNIIKDAYPNKKIRPRPSGIYRGVHMFDLRKNPVTHKITDRVGWPLFDAFGFVQAWLVQNNSKWIVYPVLNPYDRNAERDVGDAYTSKANETTTKFQGRACFKPSVASNYFGPRAPGTPWHMSHGLDE